MKEEKKLFILDAFALIYRAYFAFSKNPRINSKGFNTSAIFGFLNTLAEVIEKEKPTHIAVVFDSEGPGEREEIYDDYKAHREEIPEDIVASLPYIKEILKAMNIKTFEEPGLEADDLMACLAIKAANNGFKVYIMTSDKDLAQMVNENILIYRPARMGNGHEILGVKEVKEKFSIDDPKQIIDLLALAGDSSDNIPGVPGIGEKTAVKLIKQYKNLENILANADNIKGKLGEKLKEFNDQALLSKELATIRTDIDMNVDPEELKIKQPDKEKLLEIFSELEFKSLARRLLKEEINITPTVPGVQMDLFSQEEIDVAPEVSDIEKSDKNYHLIENAEEVERLIEKLQHQSVLAFDTETTGLDDLNAQLVGISLSFRPHEGYFILWPEQQDLQEAIIRALKNILENKKILKIAHNLKFDMNILSLYGIHVAPPAYDTMIAHYLMEPEMRHNMDYLSEVYLGYKPISIETLIGKKGKNQKSMKDVPKDLLSRYACEDADVTLQLYLKFDPLTNQQPLKKLFYEVEMPIVFVLSAMEQKGVKINEEWLKQYSQELEERLKKIENEIYDLTQMHFNIDSPKQLGEVLFNHLKIVDKPKKTKTGQYATGEEVLTQLSDRHPVIDKILEYRMLKKLKTTYVDALPTYINPHTGRIHTSFMQAVTATGRLSSNNPNLQNIPIKTEEGKKLRSVFVPENKNQWILSADYSQIELRIIASLSGEENMIADFLAGKDIHAATAARVFGVTESEVTREMRSKAKAVNFGIIYGQTPFGLSQALNISKTEAKEIIDQYFEKYPRIKEYMDKMIAFARENGYVETILGRRRYLRDINSGNSVVRGFAERNAINSPIQGSAADIIKLAMINIFHKIQEEKLKSSMILQVHDELVFEVEDEELETMKKLVKHEMENAYQLKVPLVVDVGVGKNWLEAH